MYFFHTVNEKGENKLRPLPNQFFDDNGTRSPLKTHLNTSVPKNEKHKRMDYPIGTVFATTNVKNFGGYYSIASYFPVSIGNDAIKNLEDIPSTEMRNSYKTYLEANRDSIFDQPAEPEAPRGTVMSMLRGKFALPSIEKDGFSIDDEKWYFILRNITKRIPLLLTGPSGTGKTEVVRLACEKMGVPLRWFDMGTTIDPISTLLGTHRLVGGDSVFDYSDFARAVQQPGVILLDELSRAPSLALNILFPCLDNRRVLPVEQAGEKDDRKVRIHPDCTFIATANINGVGGQFSGTNTLDDALLNRFLPLEMDYLDTEVETSLLMKRSGIKKEDAQIVSTIALELRDLFQKGDISKPVSTRESLAIAELIGDGVSTTKALMAILLPLYDNNTTGSDREIVRGIISKH